MTWFILSMCCYFYTVFASPQKPI